MSNLTDRLSGKTPTDKPEPTPAEAEPKQRPIKRPAKPKYYVPRGIAWLDEGGELIRAKAGAELPADTIPADLVSDYLKRGDVVELTTH